MLEQGMTHSSAASLPNNPSGLSREAHFPPGETPPAEVGQGSKQSISNQRLSQGGGEHLQTALPQAVWVPRSCSQGLGPLWSALSLGGQKH